MHVGGTVLGDRVGERHRAMVGRDRAQPPVHRHKTLGRVLRSPISGVSPSQITSLAGKWPSTFSSRARRAPVRGCQTYAVDEKQLDAVLIGGRERREIVIAEYDPAWPGASTPSGQRIAVALGDAALRIDHVGSTAVPDLAAKPIVDVLVTVSDVADERSYGPALQRAGYELRVREPEHRMLRTNEYAKAKGPLIGEILMRAGRSPIRDA